MREPEEDGEANMANTPGNVAVYIASMADELAQLAKRNGLDPLAYILDMARMEADQASKGDYP
jgi:hypothetical protein